MPDQLFMMTVGGYSEVVASKVSPLPFVPMSPEEVCVQCNSRGGSDGLFKSVVADGKCADKCDGSMYAFPGAVTKNDCFCRVGYFRDTSKLPTERKRQIADTGG